MLFAMPHGIEVVSPHQVFFSLLNFFPSNQRLCDPPENLRKLMEKIRMENTSVYNAAEKVGGHMYCTDV